VSGEKKTVDSLKSVRDSSPLSSRNTSKGALLQETYATFRAMSDGQPLSEVHRRILEGEVFKKTSYETRRKIRNALDHRYSFGFRRWIASSLAQASLEGIDSSRFRSLAYLYFCLRDRLTFEFVTEFVWQRWQDGITSLDREDVLTFIEGRIETKPSTAKWRESTRKKLAGNMLSALRDFGLFKGTAKKQIQRPVISAEAVFHLLTILMAEGLTGGLRRKSRNQAVRWFQYSVSRVEREAHLSAMMLLAPWTVHCMPDCLRRLPTTFLQPASTTPEPTNRPCSRKAW